MSQCPQVAFSANWSLKLRTVTPWPELPTMPPYSVWLGECQGYARLYISLYQEWLWPAGLLPPPHPSRLSVHFSQMLLARRFQAFDFGVKGNLLRYDQPVPPTIDLARVKPPHAIYGAYSLPICRGLTISASLVTTTNWSVSCLMLWRFTLWIIKTGIMWTFSLAELHQGILIICVLSSYIFVILRLLYDTIIQEMNKWNK